MALGTGVLWAEAPKLEALFPAGGQIGSSFTLAATGKLDDTVRLWTDAPGLYLTPTGKKREWQVTVSPQARPGLHHIVALNADGISDPRVFSIGQHPEITEAEPNDMVGKGQAVAKLPTCVNARLDKSGDVDGYTVTLKTGQTLHALVEAYALGSPVDVMAHVLDPAGLRVLTVSDGRNLDPRLVYTAPKDGDYTVQLAGFAHPPLADVRFTGGPTVVYRLHLSTGPVVTHLHPAALATRGKTEVTQMGSGLDAKKLGLTVDATTLPNSSDKVRQILVAGALQPIQVLAVEKPALMEKEPNNTTAQATPVPTGTLTLAGGIADKADVDRYSLILKKGEKGQARLYSRQLGLSLDATLRIEGPDGKVLATAVDQGEQPDPNATWTAAADGAYQIIVEDQFHQGGPNHHYVIDLSPAAPDVAVTLPERKPIALAPGKTAVVKVNVKPLNGYKQTTVLRVSGLPPGVAAAEVPVPEKGGDVEVKLVAATNAEPSQSPLLFQLWPLQEPMTTVTADYPLRNEDVRGTTLRDRNSAVWLLVEKKK
ncbi:PPC domain-containing protein [Prosthecobacter dejongeii]|nr:PPC domain-containing protein [Prosthecobacter dejongeii]